MGSGTAAIAIALRALKISEGKVVIPATACPHICYAVVLSGLEPVLCDINREDFNIDVDSLRKKIEVEGKKIKVVLPVHLFGYPANMEDIERVCHESGLKVIENAAQALGGSYQGRPLGSFGDISILSFGYSKIIDAGGGGAILTDNDEIARNIRDEINGFYGSTIINRQQHRIKTWLSFSQKYNAILWSMKLFPSLTRRLYFYKIEKRYADSICTEFKILKSIVRQRRESGNLYKQILCHQDITHPVYKEEAVVWRYSLLLKSNEQREKILKAVRQEGLFISKLYQPLHRVFPHLQLDSIGFPNAEDAGDRMLNLLVHPGVDKEKIERTGNIILKTLDH